MIIVNLIGGLGNQMFQYATGRALSLRLSASLKFEVSGFSGCRLHNGFELDKAFTCNPSLASKQEIRELLGWRGAWRISKLLARPRLALFRGTKLIVEPHFQYWPQIKYVSDNAVLIGYWQSERYFAEISDVIRADFTFKSPFSSRNADLAERISQGMAVSLHVRRGDYASDAKTNATHGLCSLDYYRAGIRYMTTHVDNPEFFIFSDDISWAKTNLKIDFPCTYVGHNQGIESYNDMRLMSLCRHHIIANSSFSWWGAWLNSRSDKRVVAPNKWFATTTNDTRDLLPAGWLRIG